MIKDGLRTNDDHQYLVKKQQKQQSEPITEATIIGYLAILSLTVSNVFNVYLNLFSNPLLCFIINMFAGIGIVIAANLIKEKAA